MSGMLSSTAVKIHEDMQNQLLMNKQTEAAAAMAKRALAEETAARNAHRVTAVIVFKDPGMNLNLAMRSVGKRSFIREVLIVHDLGGISNSMPKEWSDPPNNVYGKPVKYLPRRGDRKELLKFDACASDADPRNDVCYYQSSTRDTSNYLESLYTSFLRAPHVLHTSVGATTLYSDLQLTFREDAFGIDAGFAYLKAGAFFRRKYASEFIGDPLVAKFDSKKSEDAMPDLETAADSYFSLWLNRPHCELANDIIPYKRDINEPMRYERNAFARRTVLKEAHIAALKKLLSTALVTKMTSPFRLFAPKFAAMRPGFTPPKSQDPAASAPAAVASSGVTSKPTRRNTASGDASEGSQGGRSRRRRKGSGESSGARRLLDVASSGSEAAKFDKGHFASRGADVKGFPGKSAVSENGAGLSLLLSPNSISPFSSIFRGLTKKPNVTHLQRPDGYSSCHDDRCILITNIPPFDPPTEVKAFAATSKLQSLLERDTPGPNCELFRAHQYHFAVDNNADTQWVTTNANVSEGDYFGLDMLRLKKDLKNITLTVAHPFQSHLSLEVSMRGNSWYPITGYSSSHLKGSWKGKAVSAFTYDVSEALSASWKQAFGKAKKKPEKSQEIERPNTW